jgi:hypothetical protein
LGLSDGTREPLAPQTLRLGEGDVLYCRVKQGRFEARFTPQAQNALAPWLVGGPEGVAVEVAGRSYPITER